MRAFPLVAFMAAGLAACGNNDQADNSMNVDENLTAENIVANDVTAIDAVTADAANMAADVEFDTANDLAETTDTEEGSKPAAKAGGTPAPARKPASAAPSPSPEPATANSTANSTE
jgi:hypothetical protein